MATLRIPPNFRPPLTQFGRMDDDTASRLIDSLRNAPRWCTQRDLEAHLAGAGVDISDLELFGILEALISLYTVGSGSGWTVESIAERVSASPDVDLTEAERTRFASRVLEALQVDALFLAAKTLDVVTEHSNVFVGARVLTDLRPVFREDVTAPPAAAVMVHTLRIDFVHNGEVNNLFVALDEDDVGKLVKILARAADKGKTLRGLVGEPSPQIYLPTEGDEDA